MKRKPDLADLEQLVGYRLKRAFMRIHEDVRLILDEYQLTQRSFSVLSAIVSNPDVQQIDVARALGIERSGTVTIVEQLEKAGLIFRQPSPHDGRAQALRATDEGVALHKRAFLDLETYENRLFRTRNPAEREALQTQLAHIAGAGVGGAQ